MCLLVRGDTFSQFHAELLSCIVLCRIVRRGCTVQNTINSWTTNIDYWDNSVLCPIIANYLFDVCQHMPYLTLSGCKISKIHTSNCSQCTLNPPLWLQLVSPPPHVTCVVRLFPSSSKEVDHKPDRDNSSIQCKIC